MNALAEATPTTTPRPGWLRIAVAAARPQTLPASLAPVVAGTALAWRDGGLRWGPAAAALLGALCIQLGTNLHNDAADAGRGADGPDRLGPPRVVAQGWASRRAVLAWATLLFALACAPGAYLVALGGWPILALGLASLLCGWLYTGGPYPLAYLGLGELFVVAFFGVGAVSGTYYVQTLRVPLEPALCGLAIGAFAAGILAVNNLRDRAGDAKARKNTLAVRLGERFARAEHALCLLGPFALALGLFAATRWPGWLVVQAALPLALREVVLARGRDGRDLAPHLGGAGRVELLFALLLLGAAAFLPQVRA